MLKEAIEHIQRTAQPIIREVGGTTFVIDHKACVRELQETLYHPETLRLSALDTLVTLVRTETLPFLTSGPLFISVKSPTLVQCFATPDMEHRCYRQHFYSVCADVPDWKADVPDWNDTDLMSFEDMQIALRTRFMDTPDKAYALTLLSEISSGAQTTKTDNGIVTSIVTQSGVSLKDRETVRPVLTLRPYRTFMEVEQPTGSFLLRVSERGVRLIEADGGLWKLTARKTIREYLQKRLEAELAPEEYKRVFVTL